MIPNVVYAVKCKNEEANTDRNRAVEILEQIGRYACFAFMIFNVPYTCFGFWFGHALTVYLIVNGVLCTAYCAFWVICRKRKGVLRALSLSILPTAVFLFSGIVLANIPLVAFSAVFGVTHILISCKNAVKKDATKQGP